MAQALLLDLVQKADQTWHRKIDIFDGEQDLSFFVEVGGPRDGGTILLSDKKVARLVIKTLEEKGWRVVANDRLAKFSSLTPEEATVLSGAFDIERLEIEHS